MGKRSLRHKKRLLIVLTVVNILLFLGSLFCLIGTSENNKIIHSTGALSYSEEENGRVILTLNTGKEIALQFGQESVKVVCSYTEKRKEESLSLAMFIRRYAAQNGYAVTRTVTELYGEIRLHNVLYGLGIAKAQTADSDLEYEKDRRWYVNALSKLIGWMGF